jgi:hypothetical protein
MCKAVDDAGLGRPAVTGVTGSLTRAVRHFLAHLYLSRLLSFTAESWLLTAVRAKFYTHSLANRPRFGAYFRAHS